MLDILWSQVVRLGWFVPESTKGLATEIPRDSDEKIEAYLDRNQMQLGDFDWRDGVSASRSKAVALWLREEEIKS